jgi:hypothetical protein
MLYIRGSNNRYRVADDDEVIFEALQIQTADSAKANR